VDLLLVKNPYIQTTTPTKRRGIPQEYVGNQPPCAIADPAAPPPAINPINIKTHPHPCAPFEEEEVS